MEYITSVRNEKIKKIKNLNTVKARRHQKLYLIEGEHLVIEALKSQVNIKELLVTENFINHDENHIIKQLYNQTTQISDNVAKHLSSMVTPPGIFAVIAQLPISTRISYQGKWLLLDHVQDPGNVGTIIRTADAAGYQGVVLSTDSADIYAPKVQRAMQGSQFHLQLLRSDLYKIVNDFQKQQIPVYGTLVDVQAVNYKKLSAPKRFALIMGNEARGMQTELVQLVDKNLYIPLAGQAESLNVAIAAGILMFSL